MHVVCHISLKVSQSIFSCSDGEVYCIMAHTLGNVHARGLSHFLEIKPVDLVLLGWRGILYHGKHIGE